MDTHQLQTDFARIGARLRVLPERRTFRTASAAVRLDVGDDRDGEIFDLRFDASTSPDLIAVDVRPERRHLLLLLREPPVDRPHQTPVKSRFLCGHDERHWFVAGVPEAVRGVSSVRTAMDALKPAAVRQAELRAGVKPRERDRRKNAAFLRQGEWFFLPAADLVVDPFRVRRNEPPQPRGAEQAAHPGVRLPPGRDDGVRLPAIPQWHRRGGVQATADRPAGHAASAVAGDGPRPGAVRPRPGAARRPRHHRAPRLAPGGDEHRGAIRCHAARRLPRLTRALPEFVGAYIRP